MYCILAQLPFGCSWTKVDAHHATKLMRYNTGESAVRSCMPFSAYCVTEVLASLYPRRGTH